MPDQSDNPGNDPRIAQFERERAEAVELAHRAMLTSYIGGPPAGLRGDADRMVAALIKVGWTPPGERTTEDGDVLVPAAWQPGQPLPADWRTEPRGPNAT